MFKVSEENMESLHNFEEIQGFPVVERFSSFRKSSTFSKGSGNQIRPAVFLNFSDYFPEGFEINQIFPAVKMSLNFIMKRTVLDRDLK